MGIQLFDLTGANEAIRFSPFCWRTKMCLKHKGLDFEALPWRFTETARLEMSGQGRVPVLIDGDKIVHDSWNIAVYLDEAYPDRPMLMKDAAARAAARMTQDWANGTLFGPLRPIAVGDVLKLLAEPDVGYFRESREKMFGMPLEEACSEAKRTEGKTKLGQLLRTIDGTLSEHAYLGGDEPYLGDYIVFGTLMWPHTVSPDFELDGDTASAAWFQRMLDLFDNYGRGAIRATAA